MSAVPPNNPAGSVLQSNMMQRQASSLRDSAEGQRTNAARQQARAIDERDTTVGTTDGDSRVHTDSEGAGSQGRAFSDGDEELVQDDVGEETTPDDDEGQHLDLQA